MAHVCNIEVRNENQSTKLTGVTKDKTAKPADVYFGNICIRVLLILNGDFDFHSIVGVLFNSVAFIYVIGVVLVFELIDLHLAKVREYQRS